MQHAPGRMIWPEEFGIHDGIYRLSETQAQAILDLRLHRLTGLEQDKIVNEYKQLLEQIDEYLAYSRQ